MGRFLLLCLAALGVALVIPDSRAWILERSAPMANPAFRWMTGQEMQQIVEDLETLQGAGDALPHRQGEFESWVRSRYRDDRFHQDPWGTPYGLVVQGQTFRVVSAGPDGEFGTEDDLHRDGGG